MTSKKPARTDSTVQTSQAADDDSNVILVPRAGKKKGNDLPGHSIFSPARCEYEKRNPMGNSAEFGIPSKRFVTVESILEGFVHGHHLDLPQLPAPYAKLIGLCSDPQLSPRELADSIGRDRSIATGVLRISNSLRYSAETQIGSLQQAVSRLGTQRIREIVWIVSCRDHIFDVAGFEQEARDSFESSLAAAAFSQEIARTRRLHVEDAFLCGLLHDLGRPVLLQAVIDFQRRNAVKFEKSEIIQGIEAFRSTVSRRLVEKWKLPDRVARAIGEQILDDEACSMQESVVLNLAIAFSNALLDPEHYDVEALREHRMLKRLNIYPEQLALMCVKGDEILDFIRSAS